MKTHRAEKSDTDCFSTRHQKSWHRGQLGVDVHLHFCVCFYICGSNRPAKSFY